MKFDFPQVDLPCEILAWNDVTEDISKLVFTTGRLCRLFFHSQHSDAGQ